MFLSIHTIDNISVSLPVLRVLNPDSSQFLIASDENCSSLIKSGRRFSLFSQTAGGISHVRDGAIRSVSETSEGVVVNI